MQDPDRLLRLLRLVSMVSMAVILLLAGIGIFRVYSSHIIDLAEKEAVATGKAIIQLERFSLLQQGPDGTIHLALPHSRLVRFDIQMRTFLQPFNILKIKVFSPEWLILYSTDTRIIGQVDFGNQHLNTALSGNSDSRLEQKNQVLDLQAEEKFDVDVVETYVPIFTPDGKRVIGAFEIYQDVTPFRREVRSGVFLSLSLLGLILTVVFTIAYRILRQGAQQLRQAQAKLNGMATVDQLTGIDNRLEILSRAQKEISRLRRQVEPACGRMSLVLVDIDHFKSINDIYGNMAGDVILSRLAQILAESIREYDALGRYEGETFLLMLPNTDLPEAQMVAERLRSMVAKVLFSVDDQEFKLTVSLGVSTSMLEDKTIEGLLSRADDALFAAKQSGRNRVVCQQSLSTAKLQRLSPQTSDKTVLVDP